MQGATNIRLDFIRQIFSDMGFEGDEREMRTMIFVSYHTWESAIFDDMAPGKRTRLRKRRLEFLTKQ